MAAKCEVEHDWRKCWRGFCDREQKCAELARCEPFKRPPDPQGHPLDGLHINQGSLDAAADAYEAEYNKAHGIETPNVEFSGTPAALSPEAPLERRVGGAVPPAPTFGKDET